MNWLIAGILLVVGLLHLVPAIGVLGPERLQALYGQTLVEAELQLLMRHRAVLFGLLGFYMATSAFIPEWRMFGLMAGLVSVVSFLVLAASVQAEFNAQIQQVIRLDYIAMGLLLVGLGLQVKAQFQ